MARHTNWRDCKAWRDEGLPLSTTSDEAAKMFDATLTQVVAWTPDAASGGVEASMKKMMDADPDFLLGHALCNNLTALGNSHPLKTTPGYQAGVTRMTELMKVEGKVTPREMLHARASQALVHADVLGAVDLWEQILVNYPTDMFAARMVMNGHFLTGYFPQLRDSVARILPAWKPSMPLYEYLFGMYGFGLEETNFFDRGEKMAKKGIALNKRDTWSCHVVAHCHEMTGRYEEGIKFMWDTEPDWRDSGFLNHHNYWHIGLFNIEKGDYDAALGVFDSYLHEPTKSGEVFPLTDAESLLYRLELQGVNVGERWEDMHELARPHLDDHCWTFNDMHIALGCLKGQHKEEAVKRMMNSIDNFIREGSGLCHDVLRDVGRPVIKSFIAYEDGKFDQAVELLNPVRYQHYRIGGSAAQRDLIDQFFIHAAIKSQNKDHNKLARALVAERQSKKDHSPLTDRMMAKIVALHGD